MLPSEMKTFFFIAYHISRILSVSVHDVGYLETKQDCGLGSCIRDNVV